MSSADFAGWLLTYLVHSTLLLSGAWLLAPRLQSHRAREALWKTALFGGFLTATGQTALRLSPLAGQMTVPLSSLLVAQPVPDRLGGADLGAALPTVREVESAEPAGTPDRSERSSPPGGPTQSGFLMLGWGVGAVFLLGLYLIRRVRFALRIAARREVVDPPLAPMLEQLCAAAGISRPIRLTASGALPSPVALGRSEIALPEAAFTDLDPGQQRSMLAHELAHLDRRDPAWLTVACIAEHVGFIQPLNRLARRRIMESAEYLCDEWAVTRTGSGVLLAKCLAKVAEWLQAAPRSVPLAGMAEDRSHLVARVRRLLDGAPYPKGPGRRTLMTASLSVIALTLLALPGVSLAHRSSPGVSVGDPALAAGRPTLQAADTNRAIITALIGVLKDPNVEVRRAAVKSLAGFEDRAAAAGLRESLQDSDAEVRAAAVEGLGDMHDIASADAIAALLKDPNREVRAHAVESLTDLELTTPPAGLLDALRDPDAEVRHQAAHAVGHFEDARAVPTLRGMLDDPNGEVREAAVEALSEIRNEAAIQALIGALKAKDPKVRVAAADALGKH